MRWGLLAVFGLAGCDELWSIDHVDPGPACPSDYVPLPGMPNQYRYVSTQKLWDEANADCNNDLDGATHLVVLDTLDKLMGVRTLVTDATTYNLFVGYARDSVAAGGDPNVFYAVTGEKLDRVASTWDLWEAGEPNNYMGIETVVFMEGNAMMRDGEPTRTERYVCECDGRPAMKTFTLF